MPSAATVTSDQRTITLEGNLAIVGGGVTYVLVRWNNGEWEPIGSFTRDSASTDFATTFTTPNEWGMATAWEVACSNAYLTIDGVPSGAYSLSTPSAAAGTSGSITPFDAATYFWQAVDGDWNGSWTDSAHWACSSTDRRDYPQTSTAIASFEYCMRANPVTVDVDGKYTVSRLKFWGANGAKITFAGRGAATSGFTSRYDQSAITSGNEVEFRDLTLTGSGYWEVLRNTATSDVTLRLVRATAKFENYFALSSRNCRLELLDGSSLTAPSKFNMGGTNTVLVVDNSTINAPAAGMGVIFNADASPTGEVKVYLRGANPKINAGSFYNYLTAPGGYGATIILDVPKEGFASAPITMTSTKKFGERVSGGATCKIRFAVSPDSQAIRGTSKRLGNIVIVDSATPGGISTSEVADGIGAVLTRRGKPCGEFAYGVDGEPLAEGADLSTATQILLGVQGQNGATVLIMQ